MELCEHRKNLSTIRDLKAKVDNLYNALKPVLEVDTYDNPDTYLCFSAVCEAQRIYNKNNKTDFADE